MSCFLVRDGKFNESEVKKIFATAGDFPGCVAARMIDVNLSDLKAQCSACAVGSAQIEALMAEYGKKVVQHYMAAIRKNAEAAVRQFLISRAADSPLVAEDYMGESFLLRSPSPLTEMKTTALSYASRSPLTARTVPPCLTLPEHHPNHIRISMLHNLSRFRA